MRTVEFRSKFKKDFKRTLSRGNKPQRFSAVLKLLSDDHDLPASCRPHKLSGEYEGLWECHIAPDWLLIYEFPDDETVLLHRTGSHSDLFR